MKTFSEYQREAERTAGHASTWNDKILSAILGAVGEAGELANKIKKVFWHGHNWEQEIIMEEIGDTLWYLSFLCSSMGVELEDVAQMNIDKLRKRYPDGFSYEASINREE